MLEICSTIGKSHMKRSVFKHGYWAASRGLQSQGATTISILFRPNHDVFFWPNLFHSRAPCVRFGCTARECMIWTYFQSALGICSTIGKSHMNRNVLNMATELPPGDCKAKEPQLYPYCFRPKPWCIFLTKSLSSESAFVTFSMFRKGMHHLNIFSINVGDL